MSCGLTPFVAKGLHDNDEAIYKVSISRYDLIIFDALLPRKNGLAVYRELRSAGTKAPVLI